MRFVPAGLALGLLLACGGAGPDPEETRYELFTIELVGLDAGTRVFPGQSLLYELHYRGDLARNLTFTGRLTHEPSGAEAEVRWWEPPMDTARYDLRGRWFLR